MGGPWLYPISKRARTVFILKGGKQVPVSLQSYTNLVMNGRIQEDAWWYVRQNWRRIDVGDEVYVYTGEADTGIVGYATIDDVQEQLQWTPSGWYILLKFDLQKCRSLLQQPISAGVVRARWVHYPRKTVINLERFESDIQTMTPWANSP